MRWVCCNCGGGEISTLIFAALLLLMLKLPRFYLLFLGGCCCEGDLRLAVRCTTGNCCKDLCKCCT